MIGHEWLIGIFSIDLFQSFLHSILYDFITSQKSSLFRVGIRESIFRAPIEPVEWLDAAVRASLGGESSVSRFSSRKD